MTYRGHVENGSVIFDEVVVLPEGAAVQVDVLGVESEAEEAGATLYDCLKSGYRTARGLPPDASQNVDHYLYGQDKQ